MIDKHGASCDGLNCDEYESIYGQHFSVVVRRIKENGWKIKKVGGTFNHYCPKCVKPVKKYTPPEPIDTSNYWWNKY